MISTLASSSTVEPDVSAWLRLKKRPIRGASPSALRIAHVMANSRLVVARSICSLVEYWCVASLLTSQMCLYFLSRLG